jgi:RND family efflux transporter MFP subunit
MTPVEAQAMDMSQMPPPGGRAPVVLAAVARGPVASTVVYTGSAVGDVEQDVTPRVTGWITWMPFYAGDRVRKGQLLARLDSRELESRVNERRAGRAMAEQMAGIARLEYQQGRATAAQARAEAIAKEGALQEVHGMRARAQAMLRESQAGLAEARNELRAMQAELQAARQEQSEAEAMLQSAQAMEPEAQAMLGAMQADHAYWTKEIARMQVLLEQGFVSREQFQREEAMARGAEAKVRQAEARLQAVRSDIRAARSRVAKAEAMAESRLAKIAQTESRVQGVEARVEQARAEIDATNGRVRMAEGDLASARANVRAMEAMASAGAGKVRQAQASVQEAEAALTTTRVVQGYTEIRSLVDGVVTQRTISPGVLVNPGQVILKVAQIQPIRLQANVAEADLTRVRLGSPVRVRAQDGDDDKVVAAKVTSITPAVDPVTRTGIVEALVANTDGRFRPGQYVAMEIGLGGARSALRVPTSAVRWQSAPSSPVLATRRDAYVWVAEPADAGAEEPAAGADGSAYTVRRVPIRVGATDGRFIEVVSGLEAGQQVVARGHESLHPGDTVAHAAWDEEGPWELPAVETPADGGHQHPGAPEAMNRTVSVSGGATPRSGNASPRMGHGGAPAPGSAHAGRGAGGGH